MENRSYITLSPIYTACQNNVEFLARVFRLCKKDVVLQSNEAKFQKRQSIHQTPKEDDNNAKFQMMSTMQKSEQTKTKLWVGCESDAGNWTQYISEITTHGTLIFCDFCRGIQRTLCSDFGTFNKNN